MSRFTFPYGIRFQEDGRIEIFPAVEVLVLGHGDRGIRALFHVDSGATTSVLPTSDAEVLGINVNKGKRMLVRGIYGEAQAGYRHTIKIQFNGLLKRIPVIFVEYESIPRILGREGVFNNFGIMFDGAKRRTCFLDTRKERKIINSVFS